MIKFPNESAPNHKNIHVLSEFPRVTVEVREPNSTRANSQSRAPPVPPTAHTESVLAESLSLSLSLSPLKTGGSMTGRNANPFTPSQSGPPADTPPPRRLNTYGAGPGAVIRPQVAYRTSLGTPATSHHLRRLPRPTISAARSRARRARPSQWHRFG